MSTRGIPIDNARREELGALIKRESERVDREIRALVPAEVLSTKQKNGFKLPPILECEVCGWAGRTDHLCVVDESGDCPNPELVQVSYVEMAAAAGLVQREVTIEGDDEKCRCSKKNRATCSTCGGTGLIAAGTVEVRWASPKEFNPNSQQQVIRFMKYLKHPIPKHQKRVDASGDASDTTEVKELERLYTKTKHPIYPLLIQKRQLTKVKGTYHDGWEPWADQRVHTTFTFQTATWQTSSRSPNVQNGLKHADNNKDPFKHALAQAFLAMQKAEPGYVLINFDFKGFHALTTAHDFNIPDYARLARIDIHSFVACHYLHMPEKVGLWERADADMSALFKTLRKDEKFAFVRDYKTKRAILGIQFGMGYRKLYQLNRDDFENETEAKVIWDMVYGLFPRLRIAQNEVRARAAEDKRLVNKFGAIRHFFDVQRWDRKSQKWAPGEQAEQAVAFLPASHAFGHVRDNILSIRAQGWDERFGLINSIHDSLLFHCPLELRDECMALVKAELMKPSKVLIYPAMAPEGLWVGVDAASGDSLAECK
jgi:hypothetical protein